MKRIGAFLHSLTLLQRLLVLVGIGMVGLLGAVSFVGDRMVRDATQHTHREHLALARVAGLIIDEDLRSALSDLTVGADTLGPAADLERGAFYTTRFLARADHFNEGILLLSPRGDLLAANPPAATRFVRSLLSQPGIVAMLKNGGVGNSAATGSFADPANGMPTAAVYAPVMAPEGNFRGILIGIVGGGENSRLQILLEGLRSMAVTGHAELIGPDGLIVSATTDGNILRSGEHHTFYRRAMAAGVPTVDTVIDEGRFDEGNERHVMSVVPLGSTGWALAVGGDEADVLSYVFDMRRRAQLFTVLFLVSFSTVGSVVAWKMVQPVKQLTMAARAAATGEASFEIREGGEIGELSRTLESMRVRLQMLVNEIKERNETLEERVRQRTAEVEQQNRELATTAAVAASVSSSLHLGPMLQAALRKMVDIMGLEATAIYLIDKSDGKLGLQAQQGLPNDFLSRGRRLGCEENKCGLFTGCPEPVVISGHSKNCPHPDCPLHLFASVTSVPVISRKGAIGFLLVFSQNHALSHQDVRILTVIGQQISPPIENAQLYEELEEREESRRKLLQKVIAAQEDERKRLARELHDETGQTLTALGMSLEAAERSLPPSSGAMRANMRASRDLVSQALDELRKMILDLRPTALDDLGLVPALRRYTAQHLETAGIQVEFTSNGMRDRLDGLLETVLFRILQESVNNVARHSKAHRVHITLERKDDCVRGVVEDDGQGFEVDHIPAAGSEPTGRGLGLAGMRERASLVRGTVEVASRPGQGTRVMVEIPLKVGEPNGKEANTNS